MRSRFLAIGLVLLCCFGARAGNDRITATITVTNAAGTVNGQTLTVNSDTRTWTNSVAVPGTQILTNNTAAGATTNMFNQFATYPFTGLDLNWASSTNITLKTAPGGALSVSLSSGWGTVVLSTNFLTNAIVVRVPDSVEVPAQQTNIFSALALALGKSFVTNAFFESSPIAANMVGKTNAQTITGPKIFSSINGAVGAVSNGLYSGGILLNPTSTNGINYGNAFSSPGPGASSEQYGLFASALGDSSLALGNNSLAQAASAVAIGQNSTATSVGNIALGQGAFANTGSNAMALGPATLTLADNSTAVGAGAVAVHIGSVALGRNALTTAANQIRLGTATETVSAPGPLRVDGGAAFGGLVTNVTLSGTNNLPAGADIAFGRYALSTLGNGINQDIVIGTNVFVDVTGPTAAFSIEGIAGGRDGKFAIIVSTNAGFNMTIATEGGATGNDPTPANRIISLSGADRTTTGPGAATLIYHGAYQRWILLSFEP
jgi:hypothetical protein